MDCCPRCKSTNGYSYIAIERVMRGGSWGKPSEMVQTNPKFPTRAVCVDCGKSVSRVEAEGAA